MEAESAAQSSGGPDGTHSPIVGRVRTVPYRYNVTELLHALELMWALKDVKKTPLGDIARLVWGLSLPPEERRRMEAKLTDGTLRLPQRTVLLEACVRLDILQSCFQRKLLHEQDGVRFLSLDAGKQRYTTYFAMREDRVLWKRGTGPSELVALNLQEVFESRHMPISTVAYGGGTVWGKSLNTCTSLMLESGSEELWDKRRMETRGLTSDQGVESDIADAPNIIGFSPNGGGCNRPMELLRDNPDRVNDTPENSLFMFPLLMYMPDHCHMIFGALSAGLDHDPEWSNLRAACQSL